MDYILQLLEGENDNLNTKYLIEDHFKLPIEVIDNKIEINKDIQSDIELIEFKNQEDLSNNNYKENLYHCLFDPINEIDKCITNKWVYYYTNN